MKVTVHQNYTSSLRALDYFFILLVQMFENMNDKELNQWIQGGLTIEYVRRIVNELRKNLL